MEGIGPVLEGRWPFFGCSQLPGLELGQNLFHEKTSVCTVVSEDGFVVQVEDVGGIVGTNHADELLADEYLAIESLRKILAGKQTLEHI